MKSKAVLGLSRTRVALLVPVVLISLSAVGVSGWHAIRLQTNNKATVREKVRKIMADTLKQGDGMVKGVRVSARVPPTKAATEEIKRYGDDAVPVLADYLKSESQHERDLAVEFLGLLGGQRIIIPLRDVIRSDKSPTTRIIALLSIRRAPWELAAPIIREAAKTNSAAKVRAVAQDLIAGHAPK